MCVGILRTGLLSHSAHAICPSAIVIPTDIRKPCSTVDGIRVIYFVIRKIYTKSIIIPDMIANRGKRYTPCSQWASTKAKSIDESAPATQNTLYWLEANTAAKIPAQIPVRSHWSGVAPLATARDMESGIFIIATVSQLFQLLRRRWIYECFIEKNRQQW